MHNHILPGIDDGSPDCTVSKQLLEGLLELGYNRFVFTPHIIPDVHPNTPQTIAAAYNTLLDALRFLQDMPTTFAAEYMVEYSFGQMMKAQKPLCFGKDKYVLIEMSYLVESMNIKEAIFELITSGYQPILAHPERYSYYHHSFSTYEELVDAGCMLQVNLLSLTGAYGPRVQAAGEKLIKKNLVNWLGTDMHHIGHLEMLKQMAENKKVLKMLEAIPHLKNQSFDWST